MPTQNVSIDSSTGAVQNSSTLFNVVNGLPLLDSNARLPSLGLNSTGVSNAALGSDVWISMRTDGKTGSGTKDDPFNGSTATLFDTVTVAIGTNAIIHLEPGTYKTLNGVVVKAGWKLYGSGRGITTIQLAGYTAIWSGKAYVVCNTSGGPIGIGTDNVEIKSLTIDCNYAALSPAPPSANDAVCGIYFQGNNCIVQEVEVINGYGLLAGGLEQFSIGLTGGANNRIINCLTHQYATGADYTNGPGLASGTNGIIRDCADDGSTHAYGFTDFVGGLIVNCTSTANTGTGFYTDTDACTDITIADNSFGAKVCCIQFGSSAVPPGGDIKIVNNSLYSYGTAASIAFTNPHTSPYKRLTIIGNHQFDPNSNSPPFYQANTIAATGVFIAYNHTATTGALVNGGVANLDTTSAIGPNLENGVLTRGPVKANYTLQTATIANVVTATATTSGGLFQVSVYGRIRSTTSTTLTISISYTNSGGTPETNILIPTSFTAGGAQSAGALSAVGEYAYSTVSIRTGNTGTVKVVATVAGSTISYDVGASIVQVGD